MPCCVHCKRRYKRKLSYTISRNACKQLVYRCVLIFFCFKFSKRKKRLFKVVFNLRQECNDNLSNQSELAFHSLCRGTIHGIVSRALRCLLKQLINQTHFMLKCCCNSDQTHHCQTRLVHLYLERIENTIRTNWGHDEYHTVPQDVFEIVYHLVVAILTSCDLITFWQLNFGRRRQRAPVKSFHIFL